MNHSDNCTIANDWPSRIAGWRCVMQYEVATRLDAQSRKRNEPFICLSGVTSRPHLRTRNRDILVRLWYRRHAAGRVFHHEECYLAVFIENGRGIGVPRPPSLTNCCFSVIRAFRRLWDSGIIFSPIA